jgi:hypothetical protein
MLALTATQALSQGWQLQAVSRSLFQPEDLLPVGTS